MAPSSGRDNKANCGPNVRKRGRALVYERFQLRLVMPADGRNGPSGVAADTLGVPERTRRDAYELRCIVFKPADGSVGSAETRRA